MLARQTCCEARGTRPRFAGMLVKQRGGGPLLADSRSGANRRNTWANHVETKAKLLTTRSSAQSRGQRRGRNGNTYNNAGEVVSISDPAATINYTRDNLGRATTVSNTIAGLTPVVAFNQAFDHASNRTQLSAVIGGTNDFKNDYTFDDVSLTNLVDIPSATAPPCLIERLNG